MIPRPATTPAFTSATPEPDPPMTAAASAIASLPPAGDLVTIPGIAAPVRRVHVPLGDRAYDIMVGGGVLAATGRLVRDLTGARRAAVVTDETVATHHLAPLRAALDDAGIDHQAIILPPGEGTKRFGELERLLDRLLASGIERGQPVIALGGGVVGDLSGFAAAVLRRGTCFVQVPTTLLAQVDSSVGGKTGINTPHGKNLIGAFHQPAVVIADTDLLSTLPARELRAGYAEVVKYGAIDDAPFFDWLETRGTEVLSTAGGARDQAVARSCAAKARIVAADETETGQRALLNLGHTFGHAFEAAAGYDGRLLHGEAVAIGMVLAFRLSVRRGLCPVADLERLTRHLAAAGLPVRPQDVGGVTWTVDGLMAPIAQDKKAREGRVRYILARGIGRSFIAEDVAPAEVAALIGDVLAGRPDAVTSAPSPQTVSAG